MKQFLICIYILLLSVSGHTQNTTVFAKIDSSNCLIGEHRKVTVVITAKQGTILSTPYFENEIAPKVSLVSSPIVDTIESNNKQVRISYLITSIDSGKYTLRFGPYVLNNKDSVWSNTVVLNVKTVPVNVNEEIKDIKQIQIPSKDSINTLLLIALIIAGLLILAALVYLFIKLRKKYKKQDATKEQVLIEKPSDYALRLLQELESSPLIGEEKYKEFYTELTSILRTYIEQTIHVSAFEKTSNELLRDIALSGKVNSEAQHVCKQILLDSDFVKFAKHTPEKQLVYEHIGMVRLFIANTIKDNETKQIEDVQK